MPSPSPNEAKNQARALELNANKLNQAPISAPQAAPASLNAVVGDNDAQWNFSKEGGTGAMLVKSGVEPSGGAAIKIERTGAANQVQQSAKLMEVFFENAQGEAPFNAPRVTRHDAGGEGSPVAGLKAKLEQLKQDNNDPNDYRIDDQLDALQQVEQGNAAILKMEFASGPTFNKLPSEDKAALLKTDQMGLALGRAIPTVVAMQENDHLGIGNAGFKANPTNMTYNPASGQLSLIDYSSRMNYVGDSPSGEPLAQLGQNNVAELMSELYEFQAKALESPEAFEAAVEQIASGQDSPFKMTMEAFTQEGDGRSTLLNPSENSIAANEVTHEDRRRFAANLLVGSVEGMQYQKQNMDALRKAAETTHETMQVVKEKGQAPVEQEVQHFYTPEQLDNLEQAFEAMDLDGLKEKAGVRMAEMEQNRKLAVENKLAALNQDAGLLQDAAKELDQRIEALEHKKAGVLGKLKSSFDGTNERLAEARVQRQAIQQRMDEIQKESMSLMNTEAFNDAMKQQAQQAAAGQQVAAEQQVVGEQQVAAEQQVVAEQQVEVKAEDNPAANLEINEDKLEAPEARVSVRDSLKMKAPEEGMGIQAEGPVVEDEGVKKEGPGKLRNSPEMKKFMEQLDKNEESQQQSVKVRTQSIG